MPLSVVDIYGCRLVRTIAPSAPTPQLFDVYYSMYPSIYMRSRFKSNLVSARSTLPSRPISPQMLSVVKAHTTFLVAVRSSLTDTSTWDATRASHVVKLITSIRSLATIDLQDAANTLEHIRVCGCFSADQQKDIVATINSSASGPVCSPAYAR